MLAKNIFQLEKNDVVFIKTISGGLNIPFVISDINYFTELFNVYGISQPIKFNIDAVDKLVYNEISELEIKLSNLNLNENI